MDETNSILTSIKKLLGLVEEYEYFDADIVMHINSALAILTQLGVGPSEGFMITGEDETWSAFIPDGSNLEMIKSFVYMKVKLLFDPPLSSAVIESTNRMLSEFEWRIQVAAESN